MRVFSFAIARCVPWGVTLCVTAAWAQTTAPEKPATFSNAAGTASLWTGAGIDTNPRRDFTSEGITTPLDGVVSAIGLLEGQYRGSRGKVGGRYDVGARKFFKLPSQDTLVQSLSLDGTLFIGRAFDVGIWGRARDRRGAERDYSDLSAEVVVGFTPDAQIDVRLFVGAHRFLYWNRFQSSFYSPTVSFSGRYRFNKRHSLSATFGYERRSHNALTNSDPRLEEPPPNVPREDTTMTLGLSYSYRGPFALTVSYGFIDNTSNSWGETFRRHRGGITAGIQLPWQLTLLANGALIWAQYPDGLFLSSDLNLTEDDENQNAVSLKVLRPLNDTFAVDLRYGFYFNRLVNNDYIYLRQVAMVGIGAKW